MTSSGLYLYRAVIRAVIYKLNIHSFYPCWGHGGGLVDRAADSGPCDPSLIPLGEKKKQKVKEAWVGLFKKVICV